MTSTLPLADLQACEILKDLIKRTESNYARRKLFAARWYLITKHTVELYPDDGEETRK